MIIVEGADNCGKTTLIKNLLEADPSLRLLRRERFNPKKGETIGQSYIRALIPEDGDFERHSNSAVDRFFASEEIYGELFRGGSRILESERFTIQLMLRAYQPIIVHCDPGDESILATWEKRDQLYDDPRKIAQAYRYNIRTIFKGFDVLDFDWEDDNVLSIIHDHHTRLRNLKLLREIIAL